MVPSIIRVPSIIIRVPSIINMLGTLLMIDT